MAFSVAPLAAASLLGILLCLIALVAVGFIVVRTLLYGDPVSGWPSLACIITFIGGIQLLCVGILGQYLSKTYLEVKRRPIYLLKEDSAKAERSIPMSRRETLWRRWGSLLLALAAFAITAATLFAGDGIGLSDNGDFYRVMTASSLEQAVEDRSFRYVDTFRIRLEEDSALGNLSRILFSRREWRTTPPSSCCRCGCRWWGALCGTSSPARR